MGHNDVILEILVPFRGMSGGRPFIQYFIGGYDDNLKYLGDGGGLRGFTGCLAGFQYANQLIQLSHFSHGRTGKFQIDIVRKILPFSIFIFEKGGGRSNVYVSLI